MDKALELFIALQTRLVAARDERGQGTLEYVGMVIVAVILAVAVLEAADQTNIGAEFTERVKEVLDFGG